MTRRLASLCLPAALVVLLLAAAPASAKTTESCTDGAGTVKHCTYRTGPITVNPYEVKTNYDYDADGLVSHLNQDAFITGMNVDVVDADGSKVPINRLMLHHIVFLNLSKRDRTCNDFTMFDDKSKLPLMPERFYAAGEERAVLGLPPGYGYPTKANDLWLMAWMFMNHRQTKDTAFVEYNVTYDTNPDLTPVTPYWLDVRNCRADPVFTNPGGGKKGSTYKTSSTFTMPEGGRIVAGGGHVHGGGKNLVISQPDCGDREVLRSRPAWGQKKHPFYTVRPKLHEPGPIFMSGTLSQTGIPVAAGQRLKLTANYDNERTHPRSMGIAVVYVAKDDAVQGCQDIPADKHEFTFQEVNPGKPFRAKTPEYVVPLTGIDPDTGKAKTISRPPGRTRNLDSGAFINVRDYLFSRPNVRVERGSTLNWRVAQGRLHNVTVANGPRGFHSPNLNDGRVFSTKFKKSGTYRIFCALHPVSMTETVEVTK
jgi:plastocyanin